MERQLRPRSRFAWMPARSSERVSHAARLEGVRDDVCSRDPPTGGGGTAGRAAGRRRGAVESVRGGTCHRGRGRGAVRSDRDPAEQGISGSQDAPPSYTAAPGRRSAGRRGPTRRNGSRPRTDASMERRRRWAASGRLPPQLAAHFTLAEQAVLAVVAVETVKRGDCRLYHEQIAALAGVSRSTVRATLRRAKDLGVITIEERRSSAWRNLGSVVRIVGRDWIAWNRLVRRSVGQGGGAISPATTSTKVSNPRKTRTAEPSRGRIAASTLSRRTASRMASA